MIVNTMLTLLRLLFFGRGHCSFVGAEALQLSVAVALLFALAVLALAECDVVVHSLPPLLHSEIRASAISNEDFAMLCQISLLVPPRQVVQSSLPTIDATICAAIFSLRSFAKLSLIMVLNCLSASCDSNYPELGGIKSSLCSV